MNHNVGQVLERAEAVEQHRIQLLTERNYYKRKYELKVIQYESLQKHVVLHQLIIFLLFIALVVVLGLVRYVYS